MKTFSAAIVALVICAGLVAGAADITGTITLTGTPPPGIPITPLMNDPVCGKLHKETPTTHFYVVGKDGGLADVVVYLKDASGADITGKSTGAAAPTAVLDQRGCLYTPQILAVQTGQTLAVKNSDPCIHNVHSTSKVGNPEHNDVQMPGGADLHYTYDKPEMFMKFECDVHPWMFAWVSIFDNPYFSVSGPDGSFVIKNVPPGKYTLVAAHRKLGHQTQTIEVTDQNPPAVKLNFKVK